MLHDVHRVPANSGVSWHTLARRGVVEYPVYRSVWVRAPSVAMLGLHAHSSPAARPWTITAADASELTSRRTERAPDLGSWRSSYAVGDIGQKPVITDVPRDNDQLARSDVRAAAPKRCTGSDRPVDPGEFRVEALTRNYR